MGLLRSEFLFLNRARAPTEQEQYEVYAAIARTLGPERPLVVRALDVGGDKPLPYLAVPREENPFLGVRGLRLLLERPDVLRAQLRAVLRASAQGRLSLMLPMVATLAEFRAAKSILEEERAGGGKVLYRVRRLPDDVRLVGDKALFDLGLTGLRRVKGYDLAELGATLLIITHDPELAAHCDRVVVMHDGRIEERA